MVSGNRWLEQSVRRGAAYDERFTRLGQSGVDVHGEAGLVRWLLAEAAVANPSVLDAGCGTGRVAIQLAAGGTAVTGVDLDPAMLDAAREKAPSLPWVQADLSSPHLALGQTFDLVVMAGNVMIFLEPGSEREVVANVARHLNPSGLLVAGFQLDQSLSLAAYDECGAAAGLDLVDRWATWDRQEWTAASTYAVSVHRR